MDQFDPNIPGLIEGDVTSVAVLESAPFTVRNHVLDTTSRSTWPSNGRCRGDRAAVACCPHDEFMSRCMPTIGAGPEISSAPRTRTRTLRQLWRGVNCQQYSVTVPVPPPSGLVEDAGDQSGIYKLVVSVFLNSSLPSTPPFGFDITAFSEGPFIRVENPV